ncbi:hypothetical protein BA187_11115 [Serratia marcescens]|nr:hypothetical protein BA187_11115 [Serratia marcescens]
MRFLDIFLHPQRIVIALPPIIHNQSARNYIVILTVIDSAVQQYVNAPRAIRNHVYQNNAFNAAAGNVVSHVFNRPALRDLRFEK